MARVITAHGARDASLEREWRVRTSSRTSRRATRSCSAESAAAYSRCASRSAALHHSSRARTSARVRRHSRSARRACTTHKYYNRPISFPLLRIITKALSLIMAVVVILPNNEGCISNYIYCFFLVTECLFCILRRLCGL